MMHYAKLARSPRLRRVYKRDGRAITTLGLQRAANVCNAGTCCSELRQQGAVITCKRRGDRWYYKMVTTPN